MQREPSGRDPGGPAAARPGRRRPGRARRALALAGACGLLALGAAATGAGAQPGTTAPTAPPGSVPGTAVPGTVSTLAPPPPPASDAVFPARFVAPMPETPGALPQLQPADVYLTLGDDPTTPDVAVQFRSPFRLPPGTYRVTLVIGDPAGARLRTSLLSIDGRTSGTLELEDADGRTDLGGTDATFDTSGLVVLRVPLAQAPAGDAAWVEIYDNPGQVPDVVTPVVSRTALFGQAEVGLLPSSRFGRVVAADGEPTTEVVALTQAPVVSVVDKGIVVDAREPAPAEVAGAGVSGVVDTLWIAPSFDGGATSTPVVRIDRTAGTITLLDGPGPDAVDKSGDRSWIGQGLPADPGGSGTVRLDLRRIAEQLGITPSPERTAFGLSRSITLADGRTVATGPVLATLEWFESAPQPVATTMPGPTVATAAAGGPSQDELVRWGAIGGGVLLVVIVVVVVLVRRRRRADIDWIAKAAAEEEARRRGAETVELPAVDAAALADDAHPMAVLVPEERPEPVPEPTPVDEPAEEPATPVGEPAPSEPAPSEPAPSEPAPAGPVAPGDLLASLDDDLASYRERLRRLDEPGSS